MQQSHSDHQEMPRQMVFSINYVSMPAYWFQAVFETLQRLLFFTLFFLLIFLSPFSFFSSFLRIYPPFIFLSLFFIFLHSFLSFFFFPLFILFSYFSSSSFSCFCFSFFFFSSSFPSFFPHSCFSPRTCSVSGGICDQGWCPYTVHPACSLKKSPISTILLFSFARRKEAKLQL